MAARCSPPHAGLLRRRIASAAAEQLQLLRCRDHTFVFTYPHADLTPGSGDNEFTSLSVIGLEPQTRRAN
jgi:hypothetical protein